MIIYDSTSKKKLATISLYLTPAEAAELADTARYLAAHPARHHGHVRSADYAREVTVAVYTAENLSQFDAESRALLNDEVKHP